MYSGIEVDQEIEEIENNWEDYIPLPNALDINGYKIMEQFIWALPEGNVQARLAHAIGGKGAFRRFKENVYQMGMGDEWHKFENRHYEEMAVEWRNSYNIEYE